MEDTFGADVDHAQLVKLYGAASTSHALRRPRFQTDALPASAAR
jgi:hypothetical protein